MFTTRKVFRRLISAIALLLVFPVLSEFFIEWAREMGWFESPSHRVSEMIGFVESIHSSPYFPMFTAFAGAAVALWLDSWLRVQEQKVKMTALNSDGRRTLLPVKAPPDIETLIKKITEPVTDIEVIPPKMPVGGWQKYYKTRQHLKIYEAACLLSDVAPQKPLPLGLPTGYSDEIMDAIRIGKIPHDFGAPPMMVIVSANVSTGSNTAIRNWKYNQVTDTLIIDRSDLIKYFNTLGKWKAVKKLGGKIITAPPPRQSPPNTATEKQ